MRIENLVASLLIDQEGRRRFIVIPDLIPDCGLVAFQIAFDFVRESDDPGCLSLIGTLDQIKMIAHRQDGKGEPLAFATVAAAYSDDLIRVMGYVPGSELAPTVYAVHLLTAVENELLYEVDLTGFEPA